MVKSYPNEQFSMLTLLIFNVDSNLRLQFRVFMWTRVNISDRILEIFRFMTSWNQVLWNLPVSNVIIGDSWCPSKSRYMSWLISKNIFLMISDVFLVFSCEETASHPLLPRQKGVPQVNQIWCEAYSSRAHVSEIETSSRKATTLGNSYFENQIVSKCII